MPPLWQGITLQSGISVDEGYRSVKSVLVLTVGVVVPVIISGVFGDVVRKNVMGYSLDDSLLAGVTSSPRVTFSEGISSVTGVTTG